MVEYNKPFVNLLWKVWSFDLIKYRLIMNISKELESQIPLYLREGKLMDGLNTLRYIVTIITLLEIKCYLEEAWLQFRHNLNIAIIHIIMQSHIKLICNSKNIFTNIAKDSIYKIRWATTNIKPSRIRWSLKTYIARRKYYGKLYKNNSYFAK